MPPIEILLNYIFGSTTLVSIYIAYKSRKSEIKKAETGALADIGLLYDKFTTQMNNKFDEMQRTIDNQANEIHELKQTIEENQNKCLECKTKITRKPRIKK
jgi:peptidoglycan hydrolase CwlO-like protein